MKLLEVSIKLNDQEGYTVNTIALSAVERMIANVDYLEQEVETAILDAQTEMDRQLRERRRAIGWEAMAAKAEADTSPTTTPGD